MVPLGVPFGDVPLLSVVMASLDFEEDVGTNEVTVPARGLVLGETNKLAEVP